MFRPIQLTHLATCIIVAAFQPDLRSEAKQSFKANGLYKSDV